jgi:uncharacterized protein
VNETTSAAIPVIDALPIRQRVEWRVHIGGASDPAASLNVVTITGYRKRPCLAVVAGVHGDEYDGILAAQSIASRIDPDVVDGSLLIAPVANPFAFAARQRRTPLDDTDLNRVFPGRVSGTASEEVAHVLSQRLLAQADLIFILHGATSTGLLSP